MEDDFESKLENWINSDFANKLNYENNIPHIIEMIMESNSFKSYDNNSPQYTKPLLTQSEKHENQVFT